MVSKSKSSIAKMMRRKLTCEEMQALIHRMELYLEWMKRSLGDCKNGAFLASSALGGPNPLDPHIPNNREIIIIPPMDDACGPPRETRPNPQDPRETRKRGSTKKSAGRGTTRRPR